MPFFICSEQIGNGINNVGSGYLQPRQPVAWNKATFEVVEAVRPLRGQISPHNADQVGKTGNVSTKV